MGEASNESINTIKRQSEATRTRLIDTIDEIQERVSLDSAKQSVKQSVLEQFRSNPLRSAGIAAVLAYPVLNLLARIPTPLYLVAGGLWLTTRSGERTVASVSAQMKEGAAVAGAHAESLANTVSKTATEASDFISAKAAAVSDEITGLATKAKSTASGAFTTASGAFANASGAFASGASKASDAAGSAEQDAKSVMDDAKSAMESAYSQGAQAVRNHPVLVAGIGVILGAAIAASFSRSKFEDSVVGDASDRLKDLFRTGLDDGIHAVKSAADDLVKDVKATTEAEKTSLAPDVNTQRSSQAPLNTQSSPYVPNNQS
jgi:hypothetical protein